MHLQNTFRSCITDADVESTHVKEHSFITIVPPRVRIALFPINREITLVK